MSDLQIRRYKEVTPEETVERIKKILKEMGIEVEEKWSNESSVGTYSLRLCMKGTNLGQNGKGMTKEFAMASAYAEFLERFQNGMFRFRAEKPNEDIPFSSWPDEKYLTVEQLLSDNNSFLENILEKNNYKNKTKEEKIDYIKYLFNENSNLVPKEEFTSLPYYSVKNKDIEYMPENLYNYMYGTNGMCAGNSPQEAIIEGLSEILERYVGFQILKKKLVLPELPESYINKFPKVKKMVKKLKDNKDYYFRLVDCSLGGKYPVAGLYIIQKNTGRFGFKLGAHPDYGVAMERCFTEASQGRDIFEYAKNSMFDFYSEDEKEEKNLTKFINSDQSAVPYQIIGKQTDYDFYEMPDVSNLDNETILENLISKILEDGKDILVRNLSVLGFPTFSIAIPGMSEIGFDPNATYLNYAITMENLLRDLKTINLSNIAEVIKIMEIIVNNVGIEALSNFINLKDSRILPCERVGMSGKYFLGICYIMNEQYDKASKVLEDLTFILDSIEQKEVEKIMVKAVYYYASAMDKLQNHENAMYYINLLFDEEIANAIDISFKDRNNILVNHYGITEDDYVDNDDSYYLPFMKKFREAQRDNYINQMSNKDIFN